MSNNDTSYWQCWWRTFIIRRKTGAVEVLMEIF